MKKFFEALNRLARPRRPDIIEKDYYLHRLLDRISRDSYLREKMVFKGGTCLVKAYLGYYRFSEDLDFTWKDTSIWEGKSPSQTRNDCSKEISSLLEIFIDISKELGLDQIYDRVKDLGRTSRDVAAFPIIKMRRKTIIHVAVVHYNPWVAMRDS